MDSLASMRTKVHKHNIGQFIMGGVKTEVGGEGGGIGGDTAVDYMDLQALPEGCISTILSLTTPPDACRVSSVSRTFRSASESDVVWDRFLLAQSVQPQPASPPSLKSKKELYLSLYPVLFKEGKMSFSLDKWSGKKCYMLSAKQLKIAWGDTPRYWKWISVPESRFEEVAELVWVCWLEVRGKIDTRMLSPSTLYKAYLVFKSTGGAVGFEHQRVEGTVGLVGGEEPARNTLFLDAERGQAEGQGYPNERDDGWLEIELGEFFCEGGENGELEMSCLEIRGLNGKGGLIFEGIEIRPARM